MATTTRRMDHTTILWIQQMRVKTFGLNCCTLSTLIVSLFDYLRDLGLEKDLEYVKDIVKQEYTVVGTLEKMSETLDHLEATVPQFFKGIKKIYYQKCT